MAPEVFKKKAEVYITVLSELWQGRERRGEQSQLEGKLLLVEHLPKASIDLLLFYGRGSQTVGLYSYGGQMTFPGVSEQIFCISDIYIMIPYNHEVAKEIILWLESPQHEELY